MGESGKTRLQRICSIAKYIVLAGVVLCILILVGIYGVQRGAANERTDL